MRFLIIIALLIPPLFAQHDESKNDILYTNLIGAAVVAAWGTAFWDYGKTAPHMKKEEWFGRNTKYGGADKLGHLYASHLIGTGLSRLYESWGYTEHDAALYGSLSSFFLMNTMEIGDAFSGEQGFSYEDFILNTVGSITSYLFYTYPELSKRIDLRIEYLPSFSTADVLTEYEKMKYLIVLKGEGFGFITNPYLQYGELHVGYYTRNYNGENSADKERILYMGIGFNFSRLARHNGLEKSARFLNYYQLPYTYIPFENNLNR